jgi:hypothetical protein
VTCRCLICADRPVGRDAGIVDNVRQYGWSSLMVAGPVDFAYTVGLWHTFRRPELVMFGLTGNNMQLWLNACVERAGDAGWPAEGEEFHGVIEGFSTQLRAVDSSWHDALFGSANRFYSGHTVPVLQVVWPDRNGYWPWDEQATQSSRTRQAHAWLPVSQHPPGGWRLVGELEPAFEFPVGPDAWTLTSRAVLAGWRQPAWVLHDEGAFDVLDDRGYDADDLCLAYLGDLVIKHSDLAACADLPERHVASRTEAGTWTRVQQSENDQRRSQKSWETAEPV